MGVNLSKDPCNCTCWLGQRRQRSDRSTLEHSRERVDGIQS